MFLAKKVPFTAFLLHQNLMDAIPAPICAFKAAMDAALFAPKGACKHAWWFVHPHAPAGAAR